VIAGHVRMSQMNEIKGLHNRSILIYGGVLLAICILAFLLRVLPRFTDVFGADWVRFGEVDPWYHVRLVQNLLQHFPHQINFDPYTFFPSGQTVPFAPFFDWFLALLVWIIGFGSPSVHTMEVTAAYFPAVLGALIAIPVFFIGKALFDKKMGLIAAALVAIIPGDFLARSLLGVTDHHIAEALFSTTASLFLILAVRSARGQLTVAELRLGSWSRLKTPLLYAIMGGLFLGLYVATWMGGLLFVLIIYVYLFIQLLVDHFKGNSTDYLGIIAVPLFVVALLLLLPFMNRGGLSAMHPLSLAFALVTFIASTLLAKWMTSKHWNRFYFLLAALAVVLIGAGFVYAAAPRLLSSMLNYFQIFIPQSRSMTVTESQPLFFGFHISALTQSRVWSFFTTGFFFVPVGLVLLVASLIKNFRSEILFLVTWSGLMLAATLGENRFAYYLAINVSLLGGYLFWKLLEWFPWLMRRMGFRDRQEARAASQIKRKNRPLAKGAEKTTAGPTGAGWLASGMAVICGFFLVFYPNISPALEISRIKIGPSNDWHETLLWMKDNTPEPFGNTSYFNQYFSAPASGQNYKYPGSAYGVLSAWDYGHWITYIAQRIPNSNPNQSGASETAQYMTAQNEAAANQILKKLGTRYIIVDLDMVTGMFLSNTGWIGQKPELYSEVLYQSDDKGVVSPLRVYYPPYYQSMSSRLYNFAGEKVVPKTTWVISYIQKTDIHGQSYKLINFSKQFSAYAEAETYCQKNPGSKIIGSDPFTSPVPLEKLGYRMIYGSSTIVMKTGDRQISDVEIFEYQP
jgi:dolichyl-phosphooligosaccharide-protein glycotransferase